MHQTGNLQEILYLLMAAVVIVAVFKRLHLSPALGYLVAGVAIGPYGLAYIPDVESTRHIAEFGVVFLLFSIGLELTFERLKTMRRHVFGFGTLQMVITSLSIGVMSYALGASPEASVVLGGALALSSTAIVLQVLSETGAQSTQLGRLTLAVLILQDLAVVPLLIMIPLLNHEVTDLGTVIADSLMKAMVVLVIILIVGRRLLRPVLRAVTSLHSHELFIATTLLILLGTAFLTELAGLSLALGAFVAGLLVAETEYSTQVESDIQPFKGLLMGLFFMTVGMSIDFKILLQQLPYVLGLSIALMMGKATIIATLSRLFKFTPGIAVQAGLLLSQGSEFAFVLFGLAASHQVFDTELSQMLLVVVTLTMALTPLLALGGKKIARIIDLRNPVHLDPKDLTQETIDLESHIIVLGFGRAGQTICQLLRAEGIRYLALDSDPKHVHKGRKAGYPVYYGNADNIHILDSVGMKRANAVAITIDDKKHAIDIARIIHMYYPDLPIIARARDRVHANELRDAGSTIALAELFESSLMLGSSLLRRSGVPEFEIGRVIEQFRQEQDPKSQIHKFQTAPHLSTE